jgi:phosphoribosylamine--glycine ligase/phosphoribosylformylglycinamidine cyclo-ligase
VTGPSSPRTRRVLVLGPGAREHALADAIARSGAVVAVAPGNALVPSIPVGPTPSDVVRAARSFRADLVVVGPEQLLADGVADALRDAGIRCFGPTRAAARIEWDKAWANALCDEARVPKPRWAAFSDPDALAEHVAAAPYDVVVKANGLCGGKGVTLPTSKPEAVATGRALLAGSRGDAGRVVVIEERLEGPELSLHALCDGRAARLLPVSRDHKRRDDGNRGPNTGGMGAVAPVETPESDEALLATFILPILDALRARGTPFVGALYAGLMRTADGLRVLEYNARFGDPETQVILALLDTPLLDLLDGCVDGAIPPVRIRPGCAVTVVAASRGYPGAPDVGHPIIGLERLTDVAVHAAGVGPGPVTAGGRVLSVTATGPTVHAARTLAYDALSRVHFDGEQHRTDIAASGPEAAPTQSPASLAGTASPPTTYAGAGVHLDAARRSVERIGPAARRTQGPDVLAAIGAFGAVIDASRLQGLRRPALVATTDGVGTKSLLAARAGRIRGLGVDLVNHAVNDVGVMGARPWFFLDAFATGRLDPDELAAFVDGCAEACAAAGCALVGGETAEMPGIYRDGAFDVVGTLVGVVEEEEGRWGPHRVHAGDVLLGLPSTGLHTNGYSLARAVVGDRDLHTVVPELGATLADALLAPHRSYLPAFDAARPWIVSAAHITGGGVPENLPRALPAGLSAVLDDGSWPVPPIFGWLAREGRIDTDEMSRVFNLGLGAVLVVRPGDVNDALDALAPFGGLQVGQVRS